MTHREDAVATGLARAYEEAQAEIRALRRALAGSREHTRTLEDQVSRLVEENVHMRRQLQEAAASIRVSIGDLHQVATDCLRSSRLRVGVPIGGAPRRPGSAASPATG